MKKQEYKDWWHNTRREARKGAQEHFSDGIECVIVPYVRPFYATTKENAERKASKQIANALASFHGCPEPYPEEDMFGYIEVHKQVAISKY